jgi:hypothetical protein
VCLSLGFSLLALGGTFAIALAASVPASTPVPKVSGPLPTTSTSYPWNATNQNVTPIDLSKIGYQETEYLVSGLANVYTWSGNTAAVQTPNAPYTTRILVRRPANATKFSGNVIVEMLNASYGYDLDFLWQASHEYFMSVGDVWIGVTIRPSSMQSLKQFDSQRYASLSMANPVPPSATCANPADASTPASETGLAWDMISQVGTLARTPGALSALAGLNVQRMYLTGYSASATALQVYINAISPYASLPTGGAIYDGFVIGAPAGGMLGSINQCAAWVPPGDPRVVIQPNRSAVIRVNTMSDFGWWFGGPPGIGISAGSTLNRRADSNAPNDRFREYEIPGATHLWTYLTNFMPGAAEAARIGKAPVGLCGETPINNFPLQYWLDGSFQNIDTWVRSGVPAPYAPRIALNNAATPNETMVDDQFGNPVGGVRSPYVDLPRYKYVWYNDGPGCGSAGHLVPLPQSTLQVLYPTDSVYESVLIDQAFNLVGVRWVPEMDGRKIILEGVQAVSP